MTTVTTTHNHSPALPRGRLMFALDATRMQAEFNVPLVLIVIDTIAVAAGYEKRRQFDPALLSRLMTFLLCRNR
jgi:hypothetical protein